MEFDNPVLRLAGPRVLLPPVSKPPQTPTEYPPLLASGNLREVTHFLEVLLPLVGVDFFEPRKGRDCLGLWKGRNLWLLRTSPDIGLVLGRGLELIAKAILRANSELSWIFISSRKELRNRGLKIE